MAEQDLSTSQLDPLPLPIQASDIIHVARGGKDYRIERSELVKMFLSTLSDAAVSSVISGQSLVFNGTTSKWENVFVSWAMISGKPGTFQPTAHTHLWDEISDAPTSFPPAAHTHGWGEITDKPTTFPPEAHDHNTAYYTKTQLSASGAGAQVHWDNVTNVPELGTGSGDMSRSVYDQDNDGIVNAAAVVPWSGITGKPSTFAAAPHDHDDRYFTEDELRASGASAVHWDNITNKPATFGGDMTKAVYDPDNDGIIDVAAAAPWEGIVGKPSTFPPDVHNHDGTYSPLVHTHAYIPDAPSDGTLYGRKDTSWSPVSPADHIHEGIPPEIRIYAADATWTKPSGLKYIVVELIGGGGGAGAGNPTTSGQASAGRSGGGGGYAKKKILESALGSTESVVVGLGGVGGADGVTSTSGGTSSFGSHLQATGGTVGQNGSATSVFVGVEGKPGGIGSGGNINVKGGSSSPGVYIPPNSVSGNGGATVYGSGGQGQRSNNNSVAGSDGGAYGGGGSGGVNSQNQSSYAPGGAGADGLVIVYEYF